MMLLRKKLSEEKGFSLAETLIAVMIVLLVSIVVAAGMPAAKDAYYKVIESANAQVFLSTTLTVLRDELTTATVTGVSDDGNSIEYVNPITGSSRITLKDDGAFHLETYSDLEGAMKDRMLVSDALRNNPRLRLKPHKLLEIKKQDAASALFKIEDSIITVSPISVRSSLLNSEVARLDQAYSISVLMPEEVTAP